MLDVDVRRTLRRGARELLLRLLQLLLSDRLRRLRLDDVYGERERERDTRLRLPAFRPTFGVLGFFGDVLF